MEGYINLIVFDVNGNEKHFDSFEEAGLSNPFERKRVINPLKRKGGETKVAKCTKCRKTSAHKR